MRPVPVCDFRSATPTRPGRWTLSFRPPARPLRICAACRPHSSMSANQTPIAVAMSGGVDSSTVAAMLRRDGHAIVGMTMQLWNQRRLPDVAVEGATGRCCSLDDVYDARYVAETLGIPYYVVN